MKSGFHINHQIYRGAEGTVKEMGVTLFTW